MGVLSKQTIQRLAVLHAIGLWRRGAYGPVRVHKTLFFADKQNDQEWRIFTFKRHYLGQYSDEIAHSLNALRSAGAISTWFDGPAERIRSEIRPAWKLKVSRFFRSWFHDWRRGLDEAFPKWAYLTNDALIKKAHDDPTYTRTQHGQIIFESFDPQFVTFPDMPESEAEDLSDLVDERLQQGLAKKLARAVEKRTFAEDWRGIYFGESKKVAS